MAHHYTSELYHYEPKAAVCLQNICGYELAPSATLHVEAVLSAGILFLPAHIVVIAYMAPSLY